MKPADPFKISSLAELIGHDINNPLNIPEDPTAWRGIEQAPAPSVLAPVKLPNMQLSFQIAWFHRLMREWRVRCQRQAVARRLTRARASKRKVPDSPERRAFLKERHAAYMKRYRAMRKLDRLRMRGERLSREDSSELAEHRRRSILLKKARDRKRRRELRRQYIDALRRDRERGDIADPSKHVFIIDRKPDEPGK